MTTGKLNNNFTSTTEKVINPIKGMPVLITNIVLMLLSIYFFVISIIGLDKATNFINVFLLVISSVYFFIVQFIVYGSLKIIKPN